MRDPTVHLARTQQQKRRVKQTVGDEILLQKLIDDICIETVDDGYGNFEEDDHKGVGVDVLEGDAVIVFDYFP